MCFLHITCRNIGKGMKKRSLCEIKSAFFLVYLKISGCVYAQFNFLHYLCNNSSSAL